MKGKVVHLAATYKMFFRMDMLLVLVSLSGSIYYTVCLHRVFVLIFNLRIIALRKGACIHVNRVYMYCILRSCGDVTITTGWEYKLNTFPGESTH